MYVRYIQSGNIVESYEYAKFPSGGFRKHIVRRYRGRRCISSFRSWRSLNRARQQFIRLVSSNLVGVSPYFLTFTTLSVKDVKEGYRLWSSFVCRCRRLWPDFKFVCVPEFQSRGVLHFHCLLWGVDVSYFLNERVNRTIQNLWGYGYVDCIPTDGSIKLAFYFSKYMCKSLSDKRFVGAKAYCSSRNLLRSVSISSQAASSFAKEMWGLDVDNLPCKIKSYDTMWLGRAIYKQYIIKNIN